MAKKTIVISTGVVLAILILALGFLGYTFGRQVHGQYFDSAGVQIHYTDQGVGIPVILVHGYSANSDLNWRLPGILPRLQEHFRVITMDVRGHGLSDKPHDPSKYGIEMVKDVHRLMDHLKIPKAHLVGYSMGGFITLKFTAMYPERLISSMPCGAAWMTPSDPLHNLLTAIHNDMTGDNSHAAGIRSIRASLQRSVFEAVLDLDALGYVADRFKDLAVSEEELRAITISVMAVKGGEDEVVLGGGDIKAVLPGFQETIIPGGGHNSVLFSSKFRETIVDFLLTHSPEVLAGCPE